MEFKFQKDLDFQINAINSIVRLFDSQKFVDEDYWNIVENGIIPNKLDLNKSQILENLNDIQEQNKITKTDLKDMDFSIEMETGTGKTYVYLRTILELYKNYRFKKFMIVVPSIAIREGVIKNLQITEKHFKSLYDNIPYTYYEYDSKKINHIRQFARSSTIEIMIITIDSFTRDTNIMNQERDSLNGQKPIDMINKTKPILILDEPQNMETKIVKESLKKLNPLFTLRYSATHKKLYNLVYQLTPIDAFKMNLVKKIEVSSVTEDNNYNDAFIHVADIKIVSRKIKAKLDVNKKMTNNTKLAVITVTNGDDLSIKTDNPKYAGFIVTEINLKYNFIKFSNGIKLKLGQEQGKDKNKIIESQIMHTIDEHFQKYELLKHEGIKPLSLFFIDKVDNYLPENGFIKKTFERYFNIKKKEFVDFKDIDVKKVHAGYFSTMNTERSIQKDTLAFDLIMKHKEKLLSFDEPVQFIFSHSALREGWDNPNVFNICTLNQTVSSIKKRQEIGRGMRLPVNQKGDRITNKEYILTVIANESYVDYVSKLQQEYIDEYGNEFAAPKPASRKKRVILKTKHTFELDPNFKELWNKVSRKTRYEIKINTNTLINNCIKKINSEIALDSIKIKIDTVELNLKENKGIMTTFKGSSIQTLDKTFNIINIVENISNETNLTRNTIVKILIKINNMKLIFKNPHEFITSCILIIKQVLSDLLVNEIKYEKIKEWYKMELFEDIETYKDLVLQCNKSIYNGIVFDSEIEKKFAQDLDKKDERVKLFIKLPRKFTVSTPIGNYNPDWAIAMDKTDATGQIQQKLYFVTETKGTKNINELRVSEKNKILYGKKHFDTIDIDYQIVTSTDDIKT